MVTPGCCCWYLAKAALKNGATNVEPAPASVGLWPPGLKLGTVDAELPVETPLLEQAPRARTTTATELAQMPERTTRWWAMAAPRR
jgi:hypothetical protein